jgi:GDPmannose 4,6-dehydratase
MTKKTALVTGIFGQDAAYLSKLLLEKGYHVIGAHRRSSTNSSWRLKELGIDKEVEFVGMELLEFSNILRAIKSTNPDEIYNLAAQSFVGASFEQPIYTADVDALAVIRLLEAIRTTNPAIRFYQASTSEMFGKITQETQTETTPFHPRSPYGVAKLYGHWITINYRESYDIFAATGILFNHESPLRGSEFVTRKITSSLARIKSGEIEFMELGNMAAVRDWGHARDFVEGMHLMVLSNEPADFVLATGETHSIEDFVDLATDCAGFRIEWDGEGLGRHAIDRKTGKSIVRVNSKFFRPAEVDVLKGSAAKAKTILGWEPKTSFPELVREMMEADMKKVEDGIPFA